MTFKDIYKEGTVEEIIQHLKNEKISGYRYLELFKIAFDGNETLLNALGKYLNDNPTILNDYDNLFKKLNVAEIELSQLDNALKYFSPHLILKHLFNTINSYDADNLPSEEKLNAHYNLVKHTISKGANNLNNLILETSKKSHFFNTKLLNLSNTTDEKFLANLAINSITESDHTGPTHSYLPLQQISTIKFLASLNVGFNDIKFSILDESHIVPEPIKFLAEKNLISAPKTLALASKISIFNIEYDGTVITVIDEVKLAKKLEIIELAIQKGELIGEMSFADLNVEKQDIQTFKKFISNGLDPQALLLSKLDQPDALEILQYINQLEIKLNAFTLIRFLSSEHFKTELFHEQKVDALDLFFSNNNMLFKTELSTAKFFENANILGPKFVKYFEAILDVLSGNLEAFNKLYVPFKPFMHILTKLNDAVLLNHVLSKYADYIDINAIDSRGQSSLFFAKSPEIAKALIDHKAEVNIIDQYGNSWLGLPSLDLIDYAHRSGHLDNHSRSKALQNHFERGNFEFANKLFQIGIKLSASSVNSLINSIEIGLENSIENNKYHAITNLMYKAGIKIPDAHKHLVYSTNNKFEPLEFNFIKGSLQKLAVYYLGLTQFQFTNDLINSCKDASVSQIINEAFSDRNANRYASFEKLKQICTESIELDQIQNEMDEHFTVVGQALSLIDNDYALEILTSNGLPPHPLKQDITVYRGLVANIGPEEIKSWFKFGIRAFANGDFQKTLGYCARTDWNDIFSSFEFGGSYVSIDPRTAGTYAISPNSYSNTENILIEMKMHKGSPTICGSFDILYELVPSNIAGKDIIAVYSVYNGNSASKSIKILEAFDNPYNYDAPTYKIDDEIITPVNINQLYSELECRKPIFGPNKDLGLYQDYNDFITRYTPELHLQDQKTLQDNYFQGRPNFDYFNNQTTWDNALGNMHPECNWATECC